MGTYHVTDRHGKRHALKSVWYTAPTIASLRPAYDDAATRSAYETWLASTGRNKPNNRRSWSKGPDDPPAYITDGDTLPRFKTVMGKGEHQWIHYSDWWKPCQPVTKEERRAHETIIKWGLDAFFRGDHRPQAHDMADAAD